MRLRKGLLVPLLIILLASVDVAAEQTDFLARVTMLPNPVVAGPDIYLGDIAVIQTNDEELAGQLAVLKLGRAALPGKERRINLATLRVRMRQARLPEASIYIESTDSVVNIATAATVVDPAIITAAAETYLMGRAADLWSTAKDLTVNVTCAESEACIAPVGEITVAAARELGALPGNVIVSVEVRTNEALVRTVGVRCAVEVRMEVPVAIVQLGRQAELSPDQIRWEHRDVSNLRHLPLSAAVAFDTLRTVRPISPGTILTEDLVEPKPDVKRGQAVTIHLNMLGVDITAPGVAREDGRVGDVITVENTATDQVLQARVLSPDTVEPLGRR